MDQLLELEGIGNARDLGGYRAGGKTVKKGLLLRTGALTKAAPDALLKLEKTYHAGVVADLRMTDERQADPDPVIPGAENLHLPLMELRDMLRNLDPEIAAKLSSISTDRMAMFHATCEYHLIDENLYVHFLMDEKAVQSWRTFFQALLHLEEGKAFVWHCTDGKDRTGCAAMLILSALGADRETILSDYMLTNQVNRQKVEGIRQRFADSMPEDRLKLLMFLGGGVDEAYMLNAISSLNRTYGSVIGYLKDALGLSDEDLETLRRRYLEDPA